MKKTIALVISAIMIFSFMAFMPAYAAEKYENTSDFLLMLEIISEVPENEEETVTRAQFCHMLLRALKADTEGEYENPFSDVTDSTKYKGAILKATNMGIVRGDGRSRFNPDDAISYNAAVKMTVEALGYESKAYHLGGFPAGHMIVANEIQLLKGVARGKDDTLTFGAVSSLIYNFLNTDICRLKAVSETEVSYAPVAGKNPLTEYFHLQKIQGVVKSAGFMTMIPDDKSDFSRFNIDGNIFKCDIENPEKYLGRNVIAWYDSEDKVKAVFPHSRNSSVVIDAEDVDVYGDYVLTTYDSETGYEARYNVDKSFTFVKNGRNHIPAPADFLFPEGKIELIDNSGDGIYDVVIADKKEYMVVTGINTIDSIIYDNKNGGKNVTLKNTDGYYAKIDITDKNGNSTPAEFKDIQTEMVIMLSKSDDGKYVKASAMKTVLNGVLSEISDDVIKVNGFEYKLNSYFFERAYISVGKTYNFLLAPDNTITALASVQEGGMSYGYLYDYFKDDKGLGSTVQISLMTESGEYIHPELADEIYFDGKREKKTSDKIKASLTNGDLPEYQLIKYELDSNKKVVKIDTGVDASGEEVFDKYSKSFDGDNSLTRFLMPTTSYWYQTFYTFTGHAVVGSSTVMMVVPQSILSGVTERLDEQSFGVTDSSRLVTTSYKIETYDVNKEMEPGVIILYTENGGGGGGVGFGKDTRTSIVDKFTTGINEDGEKVYYLYLWSGGSFERYSIQPEEYSRFEEKGNIPAAGDIVRVAVNSADEVVEMSVDARYDEKTKLPKFTSNVPSGGAHDVNCYIGKVFAHSTSRITLLVEPDGISGVNTSYSAEIVDGITPFMLRGNERVAIFDTKTKSIRQGKLDMISDALAVGEENATRVFIKSAKHNAAEIYIYE